MSTRKKTTEEITKANLHRTLNNLKTVVAEREEVWLDFFNLIVPLLAREERIERLTPLDIQAAAMLADDCLDQYEKRWGKASS